MYAVETKHSNQLSLSHSTREVFEHSNIHLRICAKLVAVLALIPWRYDSAVCLGLEDIWLGDPVIPQDCWHPQMFPSACSEILSTAKIGGLSVRQSGWFVQTHEQIGGELHGVRKFDPQKLDQ